MKLGYIYSSTLSVSWIATFVSERVTKGTLYLAAGGTPSDISLDQKSRFKVRHEADTLKNAKCRRAKNRRFGKKRQTLTGRYLHQGREKPITSNRISRAFNQDVENRKANLTTAANRGSLMSHQMIVYKTSMTDRRREKETSNWRYHWEQEDHGPKEAFNWVNLLPSVTH